MGKRYWKVHQARAQPRSMGRFTRRTLTNTFGIPEDETMWECPDCKLTWLVKPSGPCRGCGYQPEQTPKET